MIDRITLAYVLLIAGCETPKVRPAAGPSYRDRLVVALDDLESARHEAWSCKESRSLREAGLRRVRMTLGEAKRFNGEQYAVNIDGVRCWPDGEHWMWCEEKPEQAPAMNNLELSPSVDYLPSAVGTCTTGNPVVCSLPQPPDIHLVEEHHAGPHP